MTKKNTKQIGGKTRREELAHLFNTMEVLQCITEPVVYPPHPPKLANITLENSDLKIYSVKLKMTVPAVYRLLDWGIEHGHTKLVVFNFNFSWPDFIGTTPVLTGIVTMKFVDDSEFRHLFTDNPSVSLTKITELFGTYKLGPDSPNTYFKLGT